MEPIQGTVFPEELHTYGDQWVAINEEGAEKKIIAADPDFDILKTTIKKEFERVAVRYIKVPARGASLTL